MWKPSDGSNPYGVPSGPGNADEIWAKMRTPCPECGATEKHLVIEGKKATITCGRPQFVKEPRDE